MVLHWQRVGFFVHGVMNTDNTSILGLNDSIYWSVWMVRKLLPRFGHQILPMQKAEDIVSETHLI